MHHACTMPIRGSIWICMISILTERSRRFVVIVLTSLRGVNPDKLKKVGHRTVYKMKESKEDVKEVEGTVLCDGGEDVSIVPVVYYCETVSVSSLRSFSSVCSYSKPSHPSLPVSV